MKKTAVVSVILALVMALFLLTAAADEADDTGKLFPDLTVTDTAADPATRAYPVSAKRAVVVENENVKTILIHIEDVGTTFTCYVVPEEKAHLRFEIAVTDNPETMGYADSCGQVLRAPEILDQERSAYVYDQLVEAQHGGAYAHYSAGMLTNLGFGSQDPDRIIFFLVRDEAYMDEIVDILHQTGCQGDISWEYDDSEPAGSAPSETDHAYTVYVMDQDYQPVPDVYVTFCTDTACRMATGDENGVIVFDGAPDIYHLQIVDVPEEYSFDDSFELYTDSAYGDWVLFIQKD